MLTAVSIPPEIAFAQAKWEALSKKERGDRILAAILMKGMTKTVLAERLGATFNTVQGWISGQKSADWSRWMSVCMALGIDEKWEPSLKEVAAATAHKPQRGPKARSSLTKSRPVERHAFWAARKSTG